jgi:hypothetical protein
MFGKISNKNIQSTTQKSGKDLFSKEKQQPMSKPETYQQQEPSKNIFQQNAFQTRGNMNINSGNIFGEKNLLFSQGQKVNVNMDFTMDADMDTDEIVMKNSNQTDSTQNINKGNTKTDYSNIKQPESLEEFEDIIRKKYGIISIV